MSTEKKKTGKPNGQTPSGLTGRRTDRQTDGRDGRTDILTVRKSIVPPVSRVGD